MHREFRHPGHMQSAFGAVPHMMIAFALYNTLQRGLESLLRRGFNPILNPRRNKGLLGRRKGDCNVYVTASTLQRGLQSFSKHHMNCKVCCTSLRLYYAVNR